MKAERKKAREEMDIVNVIEWRPSARSNERWFLLVRRPEGGMSSPSPLELIKSHYSYAPLALRAYGGVPE